MSLISTGIESVRAFELPTGIRQDGRYVEVPKFALVKWRSAWCDKLHQVYVNGRYSGTTLDSRCLRGAIQCGPAVAAGWALRRSTFRR